MIQSFVNFLDYVFNFNPPQEFPLQIIFWLVVIIGLLMAAFTYFRGRKTAQRELKRSLTEYPGKLITLSILLAINLLARATRIELISMRFITFILVFWILYTFYEIFSDFFVKYPEGVDQTFLNQEMVRTHLHKHKHKKKKHRRR